MNRLLNLADGALALAAGSAVQADEPAGARVPLLPAYRQECAACHLAYPPGLLPAASWRRLKANFPHHFGTEAWVDEATLKQLSGWWVANAGAYKKVARDPTSPPQDRTTRAAWCVREHDEVPPATWARPAVKSAANWAACHSRAEQGAFRELDIRIPR